MSRGQGSREVWYWVVDDVQLLQIQAGGLGDDGRRLL
jgi:hypothetical protein